MYNYCDILTKPLRHVVRPLFCLGNNCIGIDTFCSIVEKVWTNFSHTWTPSWVAHPHADRVVAHHFVVFCSVSCMLLACFCCNQAMTYGWVILCFLTPWSNFSTLLNADVWFDSHCNICGRLCPLPGFYLVETQRGGSTTANQVVANRKHAIFLTGFYVIMVNTWIGHYGIDFFVDRSIGRYRTILN